LASSASGTKQSATKLAVPSGLTPTPLNVATAAATNEASRQKSLQTVMQTSDQHEQSPGRISQSDTLTEVTMAGLSDAYQISQLNSIVHQQQDTINY
jgi:hypothetical protein